MTNWLRLSTNPPRGFRNGHRHPVQGESSRTVSSQPPFANFFHIFLVGRVQLMHFGADANVSQLNALALRLWGRSVKCVSC